MTRIETTLGKYLRQVDIRNDDLAINLLLGVSIEKKFIPSIANVVGTDFKNYKIVKKGQFAYGPVTSRNGDKVSIALLQSASKCIVSSSYTVFEITNTDELDPEYLLLFFKNPEFDRYARFNSWGSAREVFSWKDLCKTPICLPPLAEQKRIAGAYKSLVARIEWIEKTNSLLEKEVYNYYLKCIEGAQSRVRLCDVAEIVMGSSPDGASLNTDGNGCVFYQGKTDFGFRFPGVRCYTTSKGKMAQSGDILMSVRAPVGDINIAKTDCCIGRGIAAIRPRKFPFSFVYYSMLKLRHELNGFNNKGTVFGAINRDELRDLELSDPAKEIIDTFEMRAEPIDRLIKKYEAEKEKLVATIRLIYSSVR